MWGRAGIWGSRQHAGFPVTGAEAGSGCCHPQAASRAFLRFQARLMPSLLPPALLLLLGLSLSWGFSFEMSAWSQFPSLMPPLSCFGSHTEAVGRDVDGCDGCRDVVFGGQAASALCLGSSLCHSKDTSPAACCPQLPSHKTRLFPSKARSSGQPCKGSCVPRLSPFLFAPILDTPGGHGHFPAVPCSGRRCSSAASLGS